MEVQDILWRGYAPESMISESFGVHTVVENSISLTQILTLMSELELLGFSHHLKNLDHCRRTAGNFQNGMVFVFLFEGFLFFVDKNFNDIVFVYWHAD